MHLALGDEAKAGQITVVIQHQVQFDYAVGAANVAQSYIDRHRSITVESRRTSLFLKRTFRRPTALAATIPNSQSNTCSNNCQGRWPLA